MKSELTKSRSEKAKKKKKKKRQEKMESGKQIGAD